MTHESSEDYTHMTNWNWVTLHCGLKGSYFEYSACGPHDVMLSQHKQMLTIHKPFFRKIHEVWLSFTSNILVLLACFHFVHACFCFYYHFSCFSFSDHFWVTLSFFFFFLLVWSVAHTTLAAHWPVVPGTVCPLTPPRCTPFLRPAAQGQSQSWGRGPVLGPAQRPADRHAHRPVAYSKWAWRQLMMMMKGVMRRPTALRDLPTFQSVGECVWKRNHDRACMRTLVKMRNTTKRWLTSYSLVPLHVVHIKFNPRDHAKLDDTLFNHALVGTVSLETRRCPAPPSAHPGRINWPWLKQTATK